MGKFAKKAAFVFVVCILLIIGGLIFIKVNNNANNSNDINTILKSKSYSYLPVGAKNYIKKVYKETGTLILTEKNKKDNTPYLNPEYANYLSLSEPKQTKINLIPNVYTIDFTPSNKYKSTTYPTTYNINNVNGNNYTTPFKDQGNLGICWAFATVEQAESYLLKKGSTTYSSSAQLFSTRQMDYATSSDGINNYENENGTRMLSSGGNFYMSSFVMSNGLSLVDDSYMPYNESSSKKELSDILNYANSKYEVNATIMMPDVSESTSSADKEAYNNVIKDNIINNGGAYVGTGAPTGACGFKNTDGTYAVVEKDNCLGTSGHAMQIIGWDDNYKYSYCKSSSSHLSVNSSGTCSNGTLTSGTGAWILRNSWGADTSYKYVYLAYDSYGLSVDFTTSLSKMSEKTWDNNYHKNLWKDGVYIASEDTITFNKKINTSEKLKKVKFMSSSINGNYSISVETGSNTYNNIKTISTGYPGIYTIDLSDSNIVLDADTFNVTIRSTNNAYLISNTISVFTSNVDSTPNIITKNLNANDLILNTDSNYKFIVYSSTKNIASNESVSYSLYKDGVDESSYIISTANNKVAENNVNATLIINKSIPAGNYVLKTSYNGSSFDSDIVIPSVHTLTGTGTSTDPYLIYTEDDLNQMRYHLDSYYLLKNDITLTSDWLPVGTNTHPFRGGFDGGGYKINGLKISLLSDDFAGFFGYVEVKYDYNYGASQTYYGEKTYIKNVSFIDAQVKNKGSAGILIGQLLFDTSTPPAEAYNLEDPLIEIDSVNFIGGNVTSTNGAAGVLASIVNIIPGNYRTPYFSANNVFSSATINSYNASGLVAYINDSSLSDNYILNFTMKNFQNAGVIDVSSFNTAYADDNNISSVIGGVYGNAKLTFDNFIINSTFNDVSYMNSYSDSLKDSSIRSDFFIGYYDKEASTSLVCNKGHGYYVSKYNGGGKFTSSENMKDSSLYTLWTDFDKYWKIETIDSIKRIPVLKDINYSYTSMENINIKLYDEVSLLNYFNVKQNYNYVSYKILSNNNIIKISDTSKVNGFSTDFTINALSKGSATIHVVNDFDGLSKDVTVNVTADKVARPTITYYESGLSTAKSYTQQIDASLSFNLAKNQFVNSEGYKFKCWNTIPDGSGTSYTDEQLFSSGIDENLRLYAQWLTNQYIVKFDANGGTGSMSDLAVDFNSSKALTVNTFTKDNYTFNGWNTKADGTGTPYTDGQTISLTSNVTLYAQWLINKYTISFDANGGVGSMASIKKDYNSNVPLTLNTFTKTGYTFNGWNTKVDGTGTPYTNGQSIALTGNITLYAQWLINKYTISFDANGGAGSMTSITDNYGASITLPKNTFTKEGYTFGGWNLNQSGNGTSYADEKAITLNTNLTLYAQWLPIKYKIIFNSNDGKNNTVEQTLTYDKEDSLTPVSFNNSGYVFVQWDTKDDGSGTKYANQASVKNLSSVQDDVINLYAIWEEGPAYIIKVYTHDDTLDMIDGVLVGTSIDDYKKNIELSPGYTLSIDTIYTNINTGSKTRIYFNNVLYKEYTNIVRGDVNGDGKVTSADYIKVRKHIMGTGIITDNIIFSAADVNKDNKISSADYVKIRKYIMNGAGL